MSARSKPTLTDEQREALDQWWGAFDGPEAAAHAEDPAIVDLHATVAAMLADERAAREAAEAKVRAETLRNQRDFFNAIDMPAAADHCEQTAIGWDSSADDARRRAEAEGAGR